MRYKAVGFAIEERGCRRAIPLEEERYERIQTARSTCLAALSIEELFKLALDNFEEWETELLTQAQKWLLWKDDSHSEAMAGRLALDRRMVNILTAFRLYLDQTDHAVSAVFGNSSEELSAIKDYKRCLRANNLGYRFFESLRNYVQHCGLAIHAIQHGLTRVETAEGDSLHMSIVPLLDVSSIDRKNFKKQTILSEVRAKSEVIDLRPYAREYVACLIDLHRFIREKLDPQAKQCREIYNRECAGLSVFNGVPVELLSLQKIADSGMCIEEISLVSHFFEIYDDLYFRNSRVQDIQGCFTSNATFRFK